MSIKIILFLSSLEIKYLLKVNFGVLFLGVGNRKIFHIFFLSQFIDLFREFYFNLKKTNLLTVIKKIF